MFTQEQLEVIKNAAKKTKNQGELRVIDFLEANYMPQPHSFDWDGDNLFTETKWNIIKYCAEECKRQRSGEMSVYDMVNAWNYAINDEDERPIDISFIEEIGKLVEPHDNKKGFRTIPIGVGDGTPFGWIEKAKWERVPELLTILLESYYEGKLGPKDWYTGEISSKIKTAEDEFYLEYENIHPFVDGNGRSGKILYNYLNGTLDNPIMPPNFWGSSNP